MAQGAWRRARGTWRMAYMAHGIYGTCAMRRARSTALARTAQLASERRHTPTWHASASSASHPPPLYPPFVRRVCRRQIANRREITILLYTNVGGDAERDGGCLRVHPPRRTKCRTGASGADDAEVADAPLTSGRGGAVISAEPLTWVRGAASYEVVVKKQVGGGDEGVECGVTTVPPGASTSPAAT